MPAFLSSTAPFVLSLNSYSIQYSPFVSWRILHREGSTGHRPVTSRDRLNSGTITAVFCISKIVAVRYMNCDQVEISFGRFFRMV